MWVRLYGETGLSKRINITYRVVASCCFTDVSDVARSVDRRDIECFCPRVLLYNYHTDTRSHAASAVAKSLRHR